MPKKNKFKIGQVVRLLPYKHGFGTITKFLPGNEVELTFHDFDQGDTWSWMYSIHGIRPLTKKQVRNHE